MLNHIYLQIYNVRYPRGLRKIFSQIQCKVHQSSVFIAEFLINIVIFNIVWVVNWQYMLYFMVISDYDIVVLATFIILLLWFLQIGSLNLYMICSIWDPHDQYSDENKYCSLVANNSALIPVIQI